MILVNCVWRQEDIIKVVENMKKNNKNIFKLDKIEGMRMFFQSAIDDKEGVKMIKKAIRTYIPGYEALTLSILPVINGSVFEGYF